MSVKSVGKLDSWDSADVGNNDFMKIEEGDNIVRIVSSPYQFYSHWVDDVSGQNRKVRCALKDCPACGMGNEAKPHWFVAVLNRKTDKVCIAEIGPQIMKQIKSLTQQKNHKGVLMYGDPRTYDVNFKRGPKGSQPLYVVLPLEKEPLADEEKTKIKSFMEKTDLQKMTEAPAPSEIREKLGLDSPAKKVTGKSTESDGDSSVDDFDFESDSN